MAKEHEAGKREGGEGPGAGQPRATITGTPLAAALVVLIAWISILIVMMRIGADQATQDAQWSRLVTVLGSIESVAFAAAGAVFGVTVQRQRVQEANRRADDAKQVAADADKRTEEARRDTRQAEMKADRNAEAAANGKALAAAVQGRAGLARRLAMAGGGDRSAPGFVGELDDDLVVLAERLFPN
jgi:hypothetical protein